MDDLATLRWLVEAGADEALLETPLDRFSALPPPPSIAAPTPARAAPVAVAKPAAPILAAPQPAAMAEQAARTAAAAAQTLPELKAALAAFEGCSLKATATNLVFADGNPAAPILLVGEASATSRDVVGPLRRSFKNVRATNAAPTYTLVPNYWIRVPPLASRFGLKREPSMAEP